MYGFKASTTRSTVVLAPLLCNMGNKENLEEARPVGMGTQRPRATSILVKMMAYLSISWPQGEDAMIQGQARLYKQSPMVPIISITISTAMENLAVISNYMVISISRYADKV